MKSSDINFEILKADLKENKYSYIGSGSGRQVYDLGNGYVAKKAKNKKGTAQNEVEYNIGIADNTKLFAKVISVSENYEILIMEKAERIVDFSTVLNYFEVKSKRQLLRLDNIRSIYKKYDLIPQDLVRTVNWGIIHNHPVIIDFGFTWRVRRKYY